MALLFYVLGGAGLLGAAVAAALLCAAAATAALAPARPSLAHVRLALLAAAGPLGAAAAFAVQHRQARARARGARRR